VLDGASVLTLLSESPPHAVQTAGWAGRTVPAYCTAAGRALLADYDAAALKALFARTPLEPRAPRTITDVDVLARRIAEAAARGWATADEELEPGLAAVAAPVRRFDGRIIAALNVSGPSFRFSARLEQAGAEVAGAARRLSERLQKSTPGVAEVATEV
jgi:IclR family transcriptional regulator, KDG regulon repressor